MTSSLLWMRWCTQPSNLIVGCLRCSVSGITSLRGYETIIVAEIRKLKNISKQVSAYGTTKIAYKQMGVSQFKRGCVHQIEALGLQAQQAVIRDWLTIAGGAKGDVDPWIDAITEKSHGWPQHMICYALCAKDVLDQTGGEMSSAALEEVLAFGDHDRAAYYAGRVDGLKQSDIVRIAQVFSGVGPSEHMSKEDIIDSLQYGQDQACAEKLFEDLLHRGVIAYTTDGMYQSPIPSFQRWIVQNFGKDLGKG